MAMDFWLIPAILLCAVTIVAALDLLLGVTSMKNLSEIKELQGSGQLRVSIIVPACNEEENIGHAMQSLLQQDYPNIEIIAINDRSTDGTGEILDNLAKTAPQLRVIHIQDLPKGWMGKPHALQQGAAAASGDYLLFTDADIVMEHTTIARALSYVEKEKIDHLCLIFRNSSPGWLLNSLILESGAGLIQLLRPWRARKSKAREYVGVGAFNMVRKDVYDKIGGHRRIPMHPIDDIMLGKLVKKAGYKQDCLLGYDLVSVPWYASVSQMVNGLQKNVLAIINYRFSLVPLLLVSIIIFNILPYWGAFLSSGISQALFLVVIAIKLSAFVVGTRMLRIPTSCALGTIFSPYISCYIILKAALCNFKDQGIYWRGTHYSLEELRKNEPLLP